MKWRYSFLSAFALIAVVGSNQTFGDPFVIVDYPGADWTGITGVSGSTVVGGYAIGDGGTTAFTYDGSTFTTQPALAGMQPTGISGGTVVGNYYGNTNHGFIYDGSTLTTLDVPGAIATYAQGISGSTIVGYYTDSAYGGHGFKYNGSTFTTVDVPGATSTEILDISGSTVSGIYDNTGFGAHAFAYDGSKFTTWNVPGVPGSSGPDETYITGVSGSSVVGYYQPGPAIQFAGFIYDGSTFTTLDYPGAWTTEITGISGNTVFGTAISSYGTIDEDLVAYGDGFTLQLPEPANVTLIAIAALGLLPRRRKHAVL
jgi:hypothetical protein